MMYVCQEWTVIFQLNLSTLRLKAEIYFWKVWVRPKTIVQACQKNYFCSDELDDTGRMWSCASLYPDNWFQFQAVSVKVDDDAYPECLRGMEKVPHKQQKIDSMPAYNSQGVTS